MQFIFDVLDRNQLHLAVGHRLVHDRLRAFDVGGLVLQEGQLFNFTNAPIATATGLFYKLHVWAWKANPRGAFADMNPDVTCEHAHRGRFSPVWQHPPPVAISHR